MVDLISLLMLQLLELLFYYHVRLIMICQSPSTYNDNIIVFIVYILIIILLLYKIVTRAPLIQVPTVFHQHVSL